VSCTTQQETIYWDRLQTLFYLLSGKFHLIGYKRGIFIP
jgi:hypothetical protein